MTEFRYSRALRTAGLTYEIQGMIYFSLVNAGRQSRGFRRLVKTICAEIAKEDYKGLYRYLTDKTVNHNYIAMNYYIPVAKLFLWKRLAFIRMYDYIRGMYD